MADRARAIAFRGGGFVATPRRGAALIAFILIIALWEVAVRWRWVSPIFLPSPSSVVMSLYELAASGALWLHVSQSLGRIVGGWAFGTIAGLAVGFSMGIWSLARAVGLPLMVDVGGPGDFMPEALDHMGPGDILTHCFTGAGSTIVDEAGGMRPEAIRARERGVKFDIGHGAGSFSWRSAKSAIDSRWSRDFVWPCWLLAAKSCRSTTHSAGESERTKRSRRRTRILHGSRSRSPWRRRRSSSTSRSSSYRCAIWCGRRL